MAVYRIHSILHSFDRQCVPFPPFTSSNNHQPSTQTINQQQQHTIFLNTSIKRRKGITSFDERIKDLMSFKAEFGHCNVPQTRSRNNKHYSLGCWCNDMRRSYKSIKEGRSPARKLSKADIQRLENAGSGFDWSFF